MIFINLEMIFQLLLIKNIRMRLSVFTALKITAATDTHLVSFLLGITLTLGFVFMLIVDNCGSRIMHRHSTQSCRSSFELIFRDIHLFQFSILLVHSLLQNQKPHGLQLWVLLFTPQPMALHSVNIAPIEYSIFFFIRHIRCSICDESIQRGNDHFHCDYVT